MKNKIIILSLALVLIIGFISAYQKSDFLGKIETNVYPTNAYTWYRVCNPTVADYNIASKQDFNVNFNEVKNKINSYRFTTLKKTPYEVPDYEIVCNPYEFIIPANESPERKETRNNCTTVQIGTHTEYKEEWIDFNPKVFAAGKCYDIKVEGTYPLDISGIAIDNIINYYGYSFDELDWWNLTHFVDNYTNSNFSNTTLSTTVLDTAGNGFVGMNYTSQTETNPHAHWNLSYNVILKSDTTKSATGSWETNNWPKSYDNSTYYYNPGAGYAEPHDGAYIEYTLGSIKTIESVAWIGYYNEFCYFNGIFNISCDPDGSSGYTETLLYVDQTGDPPANQSYNLSATGLNKQCKKLKYWSTGCGKAGQCALLCLTYEHIAMSKTMDYSNSTYYSMGLNSSKNIDKATLTCNISTQEAGTSLTGCRMKTDGNAWQSCSFGQQLDLTNSYDLYYSFNLTTNNSANKIKIDWCEVGVTEITGATETQGDDAIERAINGSVPSASKYEDQQVYARYLNSSQDLGKFDWFVVQNSPQRRWAINYVTTNDPTSSFTYMLNITPVFRVLELQNMDEATITDAVGKMINNTKS